MKFNYLLAVILTAASCWTQTLNGRWDGTIDYGNLKVPFTLQFEGSGGSMTGTFVNGDSKVSSVPGKFDGKNLALRFPSAVARLDGILLDGELKGTYSSQPFTASPYCTCSLEGVAGPAIMGLWEVTETGWRLSVLRKGEDSMVILARPGEQDIGPVVGRHDGLAFQLHYFDGKRAGLLELEERKDGALNVTWTEPGKEVNKMKAVRAKSIGQQ